MFPNYTINNNLYSIPATNLSIIHDPLEQFEVLTLFCRSFNNLVLLWFFILLVIFIVLIVFMQPIKSVYGYISSKLYYLVTSVVKENLYMAKQQYFIAFFYLFLVILISNMFGLVPYSYTVTSSFIVTFFLAFAYFTGCNLIAFIEHR